MRLIFGLLLAQLLGPAAWAGDETHIADQIRDFLAPHIFKLNREMMTFHYTMAETEDAYRPGDLAEIASEAKFWGKDFYNVDATSYDLVGPGHYVAIDPTSSRIFGGVADPQLYVVPINAGTVILDARPELKTSQRFFFDLNTSLGCYNNPTPEQPNSTKEPRLNSQTIAKWIQLFRASNNLTCRKALIQAFADLKINAILYDYNSNELANCRHNRGEAVSIISPEAVVADQIAYFSHKKFFDPHGIGGFVTGLYTEGSKDPEFWENLLPGQEPMPASLQPTDATVANYENWKAKFIFGCGPKWNTETDKLSWREVAFQIRDKNLYQLRTELFKAYSKKMADPVNPFNTRPLNLYLLRGYQRRLATLAGVDFAVWNAAQKKYTSGLGDVDNALVETARILGEDPKPLQKIAEIDMEKIEDDMLRALIRYNTQPDLLGAWMAGLGMGPKLSLLFTSQYLHFAGAIPVVNKTFYLTYLRECLQQYQDPQMTSNQIRRGECGVISGRPRFTIR